jgi:RimJ/RimL family protein N-acetyltransferase
VAILVRELTEADVASYFAIRLEALESTPRAFASSAEEFRARSLDRVGRDLSPVPGERFTLGAFDGEALVGISTFFREERPKLRHKGWVVGVSVQASARGKGVGRNLLEVLIARVRGLEGLVQLHLAVATTQVPARALYLALGFQPWGLERRALLVDGEYVDEEHLVLELDRG